MRTIKTPKRQGSILKSLIRKVVRTAPPKRCEGMSKVNNSDPMERLIHQTFHNIAEKYGIDVDLVAEIITEYDEIMGRNLEGKAIITEN